MVRRYILVPFFLLSVAACSSVPGERPDEAKSAQVNMAALVDAADATRLDGRLSEAVQIYQQILIGDPKSVAGQYGMAECLLGLQRPKEAQVIFSSLTGDARFGAQAMQGVGLSNLALNKRETAANSLRDALAKDPGLWRAFNSLAMIADFERRPDEAADLYAKALALNPDSATLLNNRGYSRLLAGKPDEALASLRKALLLEPDSEVVQNNLRLAIAAKGNYAEATRNMPRDKMPAVLNNVGYIAMQRGDFTAAQGLLSRAMANNPNYDAVTARNLEELSVVNGGAK